MQHPHSPIFASLIYRGHLGLDAVSLGLDATQKGGISMAWSSVPASSHRIFSSPPLQRICGFGCCEFGSCGIGFYSRGRNRFRILSVGSSCSVCLLFVASRFFSSPVCRGCVGLDAVSVGLDATQRGGMGLGSIGFNSFSVCLYSLRGLVNVFLLTVLT